MSMIGFFLESQMACAAGFKRTEKENINLIFLLTYIIFIRSKYSNYYCILNMNPWGEGGGERLSQCQWT